MGECLGNLFENRQEESISTTSEKQQPDQWCEFGVEVSVCFNSWWMGEDLKKLF